MEANVADSVQIVSASPGHWPALARIIHRDMKMDAGQISYYLRHYQPGTGVALLDGRLAGCYVFYEIPRPEVAWLGIIVVDGSIQSRGVGHRLIEHLERRAADDGFSAIEMSVDPANARAQVFYERHGYYRLDRPGKTFTYTKPIIPAAPRHPRGLVPRLMNALASNTIRRLQYALSVRLP